MIDLPNGFPQYCRDLKQMLDEKVSAYNKTVRYFDKVRGMVFSDNFDELHFADKVKEKEIDLSKYDLQYKLDFIKKYHSQYHIQKNEHNALADARWNKELHKFLNRL